MHLKAEMKRLLDETPGMNLVAFGDLSSGLVLNSASKETCPREVLDLLCEKAIDCFSLLGQAAQASVPEGETLGRSVIHFNERGSQIFARHPGNAEDVICAICDPGADLERMLQATLVLAGKIDGPK
jgi:hypothetical protein